MKRFIFFLLLLLAILLLLLLAKCARDSDADDVRLGLGPVAYSIWPDGSLAVAAPVVNAGERSAADVKILAVSLGSGTRVTPGLLPVPLGEIIPTGAVALNARFAGLAVPGTYSFSVSGSFQLGGKTHAFKSSVDVAVAIPGVAPQPPGTVTVPRQTTTGVPTPPSPIPQENDNNPAGPPIPDGPVQTPFNIAPTGTGVASSSGAGSGVTFVRDTGTGQSGNFPPDPTVAATASAGGVVFASGNTYVLFSKDDGQTFTRVDPTTIGFPNADGGMCCDQVILYSPKVNLFFWLIQYNSSAPNPPNPALPGPNRLRVAWASPESMKTNINAWTFFDLTSATFKLGQQALDFPDLALTDRFLYVSVDRQTSTTAVQGLVVARVPLSDIIAGGNIGITYYTSTESAAMSTATGSRLAQNAGDTMYWGGHVDASHIKVFRWPDANGSMVTPHDAAVNTWCKSAVNYTSTAPDKQQWLDNSRTSASSIIGATRKPFKGIVPPGGTPPNGEVWLAWGAGADDVGGPCTQGRPQPYVKIARVDDQTLDVVGEYHIWNSAYGFAYPALATDPNGEIGVSVAFGGAGNFASTTVGYLGDFVVYYVEPSDVTLTFTKTDNSTPPKTIVDSAGNPILFTRYGDYFAVRNSGPNGAYFSSQGYAVKLTNPAVSKNCTTTPGCTFRPHYEQWSRPAVPGPR